MKNIEVKHIKTQIKNYIKKAVKGADFYTYFSNDISDCKNYKELIYTLTYMIEDLANRLWSE